MTEEMKAAHTERPHATQKLIEYALLLNWNRLASTHHQANPDSQGLMPKQQLTRFPISRTA